MTNFIKLTSSVINKLHIVKIIQRPSTYYLHMNHPNIDGFMLFSFGSISTTHDVITICETTNQIDYYIIKKFIEEIA